MRNAYGEIVTPQYEVTLRTWASTASLERAKKDHDTESYSFTQCSNYREAAKMAKALSLKIGQVVDGCELVDVTIVCYFEDDTSSYNQAWMEYYEGGKKEGRYDV